MKRLVKFLLLLITVITLVSGVNAQSTTSQQSAITVFPSIQDITVKPGEKTRFQIQFRNGSDNVLVGNVKVADFIVTDNRGTPALLESTAEKPSYAASSWITLSDKIVAIPKNEIVSIYGSVSPPSTVAACGYYAIVYFEPNSETVKRLGAVEQQSAASVSSKVGGILNFVVDGRECKEKMMVTNFSVPSFQEYGPIKLTYDILNQGDVHMVPKGAVSVTDWFGKALDQKAIREVRIFPGKEREYNEAFGEKWMIGKYNVALRASYGKNGMPLMSMATVWVFPWKVAAVILLTLILLGIILFNVYRRFIYKEHRLEEELEKEQEEIEKLKSQIKKRDD